METFIYMGMEYPKDSIYAEEMCKHMFSPGFSGYSLDLWEKTKEFGKQNNMTVQQMTEHLNKLYGTEPEKQDNSLDGFLKEKRNESLNPFPLPLPSPSDSLKSSRQ